MESRERCSCKEIADKSFIDDPVVKAAALRASPGIVSLITYNVPDEMIFRTISGAQGPPFDYKGPYVCPGSGVIIQCQDAGDGTYLSTILAPAHIFKRTNDLDPRQIKVNVRVFGGMLYEGHLEIYDFYFNLAAVTILSDSPLLPANLRHVSDSNQQLQSDGERPFQLQRHSYLNLFKVQSGTKLMMAERSCVDPYTILVSTCVFGTRRRRSSTRRESTMYRKELMPLKNFDFQRCVIGGAVINYSGEVIGICFNNASFMPFNLVSRWWDYYKSCGQLLRPYVPVAVANIVRGVVVTKVEENSAHELDIKCNDIIVGCDGNSIRSKLEFLERIWDSAGRAMKLNVLRDNQMKSIGLTIGDTAPEESYKWGIPDCRELKED